MFGKIARNFIKQAIKLHNNLDNTNNRESDLSQFLPFIPAIITRIFR